MRLIIVGNGVAGINTALTVLKSQPDAQITVYSEEPYLYYPRPRLWEFLSGKLSLDQTYFYPQSWYDERGIKVRLGTPVKAVRPADKCVVLSDGSTDTYDRLLLASGGVPAVPPLDNVTLPGVFTIRNIRDALAIRDYARNARTAAVIGGGLLGLESARGLKDLGLDVTVIEFFPYLLPRQLDKEGAAVLNQKFEGMGIKTLLGAASQGIEGEGRAKGVLLKDGRHVPGDIVLISTGVRCNSKLAAEAGLQVNKGIIVDGRLQTSAPDIFAAGDVVEFEGRSYGIIPAAIEQARVAAGSILGQSEVYKGTVPSNTLKVVGVDLTSVGTFTAPDETHREYRTADPARGLYKKLVVKDNKLVGVILMGYPKQAPRFTRLVRDAQPLTETVEALLNDE